jgi:osmotically-inducible protein OsmY
MVREPAISRKVTLRGEVEWQDQKQDAERVVRRLQDVIGVST